MTRSEHNENLYANITLCSNDFVNVRQLILIDGREPFFFRRHAVPFVTLQRAITPAVWEPIVQDNRSRASNLIVRENLAGAELEIFFLGMTVIHAISSGDRLVINKINLKVLGFDIIGKADEMRIGDLRFAKNTFKDIDAGIRIKSIVVGKPHHALEN